MRGARDNYMVGSRAVMALLSGESGHEARTGAMMLVDAMNDLRLMRAYMEAFMGIDKKHRKR